jgi:GGDEF domain-containing protein
LIKILTNIEFPLFIDKLESVRVHEKVLVHVETDALRFSQYCQHSSPDILIVVPNLRFDSEFEKIKMNSQTGALWVACHNDLTVNREWVNDCDAIVSFTDSKEKLQKLLKIFLDIRTLRQSQKLDSFSDKELVKKIILERKLFLIARKGFEQTISHKNFETKCLKFINSSFQIEKKIDEITRYMTSFFEGAKCVVSLKHDSKTLVYSSTDNSFFKGQLFNVKDTVLEAALVGTPVFERELDSPLLSDTGDVAVLAFPIKAGAEIIGLFTFYRDASCSFELRDYTTVWDIVRELGDLFVGVSIDDVFNISLEKDTGLYSKGSFLKCIENEIDFCDRNSLNLSLLKIQLNGLSELKESFGNDLCNQLVASLKIGIQKFLVNGALMGRFDFDEFGVLIRNTNSKQASILANAVSEFVDHRNYQLMKIINSNGDKDKVLLELEGVSSVNVVDLDKDQNVRGWVKNLWNEHFKRVHNSRMKYLEDAAASQINLSSVIGFASFPIQVGVSSDKDIVLNAEDIVFNDVSEGIDYKNDLILMADKALDFAKQSTTCQSVSFRSICAELQPSSKF